MRLWRMNTGVASADEGGSLKLGQRPGRRVVRFGVPGQADLTGILPGGIRLEIETKTDNGRQSIDQQNYQRMIERFGGVYVLARSVEDAWEAIGPYLGTGDGGKSAA
jgi:hypothetical protein